MTEVQRQDLLKQKEQFPQGWLLVRLQDVALVMDVDHKMPKAREKGVPFISPKDFKEGSVIDFSGAKRISREDFARLSRKCKVQTGDIIYSRIGTVGKVRLAPNIEFGISYSLAIVRPTMNAFDTKCLYYLLQSPLVYQQALRGRRSIGVPDLGLNDMRNFVIPLIPIKEQLRISRKIEELFTKLEAGIEALHRAKIQCKNFKQSFLQSAYSGELTIPKQSEKSKSSKGVESCIPDGWKVMKIKDVVGKVTTVNPIKDHVKEFLYLDIASIDNSIQRITSPKKLEGKNAPSRARQLVRAGDILFSTVRTYLKNIAIVDEVYDSQIASTGFCVLRPSSLVNNKYIFYFVQTTNFLNALTQLQRGTSYPAVRDSDVFSQDIPVPPLEEQIRLVSRIEESFSLAENTLSVIDSSLMLGIKLKQALLKAAFKGTLAKQDTRDEPADLLLLRIKEHSLETRDLRGLAK